MKKCPKCESYAIVKDGFVGNPPVQRYKCNTCQYRSSKEVTKYKLDSYENAVITSILKGKTYSEIAREIGIHRSSVMRWVKTKSLEEKGLLKRLVLSLMMYLEKVDPKEISRLLALPPILIKFWIKSYKDMPVRNLPRHSGESYEITSWDTSNLFVENKPYRIEYYLGGFTIIIISSIPNEFLPITITKPGSSSQPVLDGFVRMRAIQLQLIGMDSESIVEYLDLEESDLSDFMNMSLEECRKSYIGEPIIKTVPIEYFHYIEVFIEMMDGEILLNR